MPQRPRRRLAASNSCHSIRFQGSHFPPRNSPFGFRRRRSRPSLRAGILRSRVPFSLWSASAGFRPRVRQSLRDVAATGARAASAPEFPLPFRWQTSRSWCCACRPPGLPGTRPYRERDAKDRGPPFARDRWTSPTRTFELKPKFIGPPAFPVSEWRHTRFLICNWFKENTDISY